MSPTLYLIDGHALAYRTYFALSAAGSNRWQTSSGEPTAGVFGFFSVILRLLEQNKPEYLAVAFDTGKTFRDELFKAYKATRAKMPEDLRPQMDRIRQIVDAFNFPRLEVEGFEADDVLGTIAVQAAAKGFGVKIITGDRDLLQMVNERIVVNLPGGKLADSKDYVTIKDVVDYMGVRPDQIVDYKALVGDSSDNIPGVKGIGEKSAVSLFSQYDTLDEVYQHLDTLPPRIKGLLENGKESAYMSYNLAKIRTDVPITLELEKAKTNQYNLPLILDLFKELEFRTLAPKIQAIAGGENPTKSFEPQPKQQLSLFGEPVTRVGIVREPAGAVTIVDNQEKLDTLLSALNSAQTISLDTETTSTDPFSAGLVGISLAVEEGKPFYIPVGHLTGENQLPLSRLSNALSPVLGDPQKAIIGHNLKFDAEVLKQAGIGLRNLAFDTMIAAWCISPDSRHLGLKDMAEERLGLLMTHIEELIGKGKNQINMAEVPVQKTADYAGADADVPLKLKPQLENDLIKHNAEKIFNDLEMPLIPILMDMEEMGISLDVPFFKKMSGELNQRMVEIQNEIYQSVGYPFNLNSTQQLSKALFDNLRLPHPDARKKTSSGFYSTSAEVLESLSGSHPVIDWMLEYRELSKLASTYVDVLPQKVKATTGRIHTSFNQIGSVTGRLASSEPNLQNIPTRTEIGRRVRQGFVAAPGNVLVSADYSQIELRIVAHLSGDQAMLEAFHQGQDIHAATAAAIYGLPIDKVSKEQRRHAKAINFGLIYGMSAFGLSNTTDLTLAESENFVKAYFQQFPSVKSYLDDLRKSAAQLGYVETILGRRRYFPDLAATSQINRNLRNREEREAINAPIQGTAADFIKIAMIRLPAELAKKHLQARMLLQVHDELILECPEEELSSVVQTVKHTMENAYNISVPLETEARFGKNWGSLKTIS